MYACQRELTPYNAPPLTRHNGKHTLRFAIREGGRTVGAGVVAKVLS
ncbi:hypothetical protein N4G41_22345 [Kosakonia sacchari]|nr:hypothetical protein [Kosakonia sacchari]MDZ7324376.1 hypothetical protein [Kosakonia sacchari]